MADELLKKFMLLVLFQWCLKIKQELRVQLSAAHTKAHIIKGDYLSRLEKNVKNVV
jgi:hypothetical protein